MVAGKGDYERKDRPHMKFFTGFLQLSLEESLEGLDDGL